MTGAFVSFAHVCTLVVFAFFPFLYTEEPFPLWLMCAALGVGVFCSAAGAVCTISVYDALKIRCGLYEEKLVMYMGLLEKRGRSLSARYIL